MLTVLRFFEPPLRLTLRVPDGLSLATPQMRPSNAAAHRSTRLVGLPATLS